MKKLKSIKNVVFFFTALSALSLSVLKAQQAELTPVEGQQCHCWQIKVFGTVIVEKCNDACGDGDESNGESSNGSGWTWFP